VQERVDRIGNSLIPAYQRDLPADDPTKVDLRFQVVDGAKRRDAMTLSNGIVLIPEQLVVRLESDAQLAAVLADNIACALEKQDLRAIPARRALTASDVSLWAGGAFVPGLGLAPVVTDGVTKSQMQRHAEEQSGRVSLVLLRQAGYDITEARRRCGGCSRR
jgi:predicted Zn-dependent protease